ncbi:hypothetical protein PIB30_007759 [Stylosanthes scabra]|uniref:RNase H type-1 domain-containing protein n=1 Tax=Stylosanthes scabra TaxID=79078 RepID=A0ABU6Y6E9_9FABA|nr:hypothetical protein [Stylosanthes scabra]
MAQDDVCCVCGSYTESLLHVLRDCRVAYKTWKSIDNTLSQGNFSANPMMIGCWKISLLDPHTKLAKDYFLAQSAFLHSRSEVGSFAEKQICWKPPTRPFVKLNSDGSVTKDGHAACGGILRDYDGRFLAGFSATLETAL